MKNTIICIIILFLCFVLNNLYNINQRIDTLKETLTQLDILDDIYYEIDWVRIISNRTYNKTLEINKWLNDKCLSAY